MKIQFKSKGEYMESVVIKIHRYAKNNRVAIVGLDEGTGFPWGNISVNLVDHHLPGENWTYIDMPNLRRTIEEKRLLDLLMEAGVIEEVHDFRGSSGWNIEAYPLVKLTEKVMNAIQ